MASSCGSVNPTSSILGTVTNGLCPQVITRTWAFVDTCGATNTCSQTVTVEHCAAQPSCLVSWWPADGKPHDIIGGNDGTLQGNATYAPGEVGLGFDLDGNASSYVNVPDSPSLDIAGPLTIECWVQRDSVVLTPGNDKVILWRGYDGTDVTSPYGLAVGLSNRIDGLIANGSAESFVSSSTLLQVGVWYHVAFVADGNNLSLYINGVLDNSTPQTVNPAGYPKSLVIGGGLGYSVNSFDGLIDELSLYNCALSSNQIAALYAAGSVGKCQLPELFCFPNKTVPCGTAWSFDQPVASSCGSVNPTPAILGTVTNGICPQNITRTWLFVDACGSTNTCSQTVTVASTNPPVLVCAGNKTVACGLCTPPGYTILRSFTTNANDGQNPYGGLVKASDGAFYGATSESSSGPGTIFKINQDGSGFTVLHYFTGAPADGGLPEGGLIEGLDGALYGMTVFGGPAGIGTVFKINKDGSGFQLLDSFTGGGWNPVGQLVQGSDGRLYGTLSSGGAGGGEVFSVNPDGSGIAVLHDWPAFASDGEDPQVQGLVLGSDGSLYGITYQGGSANRGTIFKMHTDGSGYTILHNFTGGADGGYPIAGLLQGSGGVLYGTAGSYGVGGLGTLFKLNDDGSGFAVLHSFSGADGSAPEAGLALGPDGALYGTTHVGGASDAGTVFKLNPDGTGFVVLYSFAGGADGQAPSYGALVTGSDGALYGTTYQGGANGAGTIYRLGCLASKGFDAPAAYDACNGISLLPVVISIVTNGACPQYITQTWLVTNLCGLSNTCSQTITILDSTGPTVTCPSNIVVVTCSTNVQVSWSVTATDLCSVVGTYSIPPSGTYFQRDTTNGVSVFATNACGVSRTCGFLVIVVRPSLTIVNGPGHNKVTLTWLDGGILQEGNAPGGHYTDIPGAISPCTLPSTNDHRFYRLRCP